MPGNNLAFFLRQLRRNSWFTTINILGLSIGMCAAIIIFLIVFFESSFDHGIKDRDRVYRIVIDAHFGNEEGHSAAVPGPLALAIPREITGVDQVIPVYYYPFDGTPKVSLAAANGLPEKIFKRQQGIIFTTPEYTDALNLRWLAGSPSSSLTDPYQVVLTASRAGDYFPGIPFSSLIGRRIRYNDDFSALVSGIVSDPGARYSMAASELVSFATVTQTALGEQFMMKNWDDWMAYSEVYIRIGEGKKAADVEASLGQLLRKQAKPLVAGQKAPFTLKMQSLADVHFNPKYAGFNARIADRDTLTGLIFIGTFLLLLGSINFINLTTADAARRAREIGVRKTLGSSRAQLIRMFLGETFFITAFAATLSLVMTPVFLKVFAGFLPPGLTFFPLHEPGLWIFLFCLVCIVTLLSGLYPAFILSGYRPAAVLKNQAAGGRETRFAWVRKGLTISQFVVAQFFLIATVTVARQIHYALDLDMGFDKSAIMTFNLPRESGDSAGLHHAALQQMLAAMPELKTTSIGELPPAGRGVAITNISFAQKKALKADVQIRFGQPAYLSVYGLKLTAGRNVVSSDTAREFLINESYARLLGFRNPESAIGEVLEWNNKKLPVVGILRDFHTMDIRASVGPLVFTEGGGGTMHLLLQPGVTKSGWKKAIARMQSLFATLYPQEDFNYVFYDDQIAAMYNRDVQVASLLTWATALTVIISCMGLLGLVIYTTRTRKKEISIRKVLGGTVIHIVHILSAGFLRLIVMAFLIAAPLAWWAGSIWLRQFAYRTPLSWWIFVSSGVGLILAAVITLSIHTFRAARVNPAQNLKTE